MRENQRPQSDVADSMRIDLVITELNVGGAEKALTRLACGLRQRGHETRVLSIGSRPRTPRDALVHRLESEGIPVEFGGFDSSAKLVSAIRWLIDQLRSRPADVCQTFLFHANCLGAYAAQKAGVECTVGGIRVAEDRPLRCFVERCAARRMRHAVCVSDAVRSFAESRLAIPRDRLSVIANGTELIDLNRSVPFDWTNLGLSGDAKVILFVGRLHPQKGIELLQQQFSAILGRDGDRRLVIIGDGPLRDSIDSWIRRTDQTRIRLLPFQRDIAPFLLGSELLILPSHYEGMPNVVLEAMAASRAVVCSRVEGAAELFGKHLPDDARYRLQTFPREDGMAMAHLVSNLFADDELRKKARQGKP